MILHGAYGKVDAEMTPAARQKTRQAFVKRFHASGLPSYWYLYLFFRERRLPEPDATGQRLRPPSPAHKD